MLLQARGARGPSPPQTPSQSALISAVGCVGLSPCVLKGCQCPKAHHVQCLLLQTSAEFEDLEELPAAHWYKLRGHCQPSCPLSHPTTSNNNKMNIHSSLQEHNIKLLSLNANGGLLSAQQLNNFRICLSSLLSCHSQDKFPCAKRLQVSQYHS